MSKFYFFYKSSSPFSQWYPCEFKIDDIVFTSCEQAMMYYKALLFNDKEIANKILQIKDQRKIKMLGRKVKNFDDTIWNNNKEAIVFRNNYAKFSQNQKLLKYLLDTGDLTLVEASPYDKIWGIGLSVSDPKAQNPSLWRGQNLLGKILTDIKQKLII